MKSFGWCVVLVLVLGLLGSVGAARAQYEDDTYEGPPADGWMGTEDVLPGLRLGIGPQFATNPNDTMLTGQLLVAADLRFEDNLGASIELGYSGERRGRLAGRHLVLGGAVRFGTIVGLSPLVHGIIGRTHGEPLVPTRRSGGLRIGGRLDIARMAGVDIQYEYRAIHRSDSESGFRVVLWLDALFVLKVVGFSN